MGVRERRHSNGHLVCMHIIIYYNTCTIMKHRKYNNPSPSEEIILEGITRLKGAIERSLSAGSIRLNKFTVEFRLDVLQVVFGNKTVFQQTDFPPHLFQGQWTASYSRIGDGCKILFPIKMKGSLKWSKQNYMISGDGSLKPKRRHFTEIIHVTLNKTCCSS